MGLMFLFSSCGQTFNSNTNDVLLVASSYCEDQGNTRLCEANEIIQKNCTSCHSGYHSSWGAYDKDSQWLSTGLVVRGDPDNSSLYRKCSGSGFPEANMPYNAPDLSSTQLDSLRAWILNI